jgi:hypothetical protein
MERIKRFLLDETASSEAASSVLLIAGVGTLLLVGVMAYYGAMNAFFDKVRAWVASVTASSFNIAASG